MKRYSGLHDKLCTIENIEVADDNARKNKNKKYGIKLDIRKFYPSIPHDGLKKCIKNSILFYT